MEATVQSPYVQDYSSRYHNIVGVERASNLIIVYALI